jgi:hypothetical protein
VLNFELVDDLVDGLTKPYVFTAVPELVFVRTVEPAIMNPPVMLLQQGLLYLRLSL